MAEKKNRYLDVYDVTTGITLHRFNMEGMSDSGGKVFANAIQANLPKKQIVKHRVSDKVMQTGFMPE